MNKITLLAIDTAKYSFAINGLDQKGNTVLKKAVSREKLMPMVATMPRCTIAMEACGGSHFLARKFREYGHEVKLIAPQKVVPFRKTNKNDANDALAIGLTALCPQMEFVQIKETWQQDIQSLHRARERSVKNQTAIVNEMRGFLFEYGFLIKEGINHARASIPCFVQDIENGLTPIVRELVADLYAELLTITENLERIDNKLVQIAKNNEACRRLNAIEGIGVITATAIIALCLDVKSFRNGRQFAAFLGLTPGHHQTGGKNSKPIMGGITKRGNSNIRTLLVQGGMSIVGATQRQENIKNKKSEEPIENGEGVLETTAKKKLALAPIKKRKKAGSIQTEFTKSNERRKWLKRLIDEKGPQKAAVAWANKNARIIWAMLARNEAYDVEKCSRKVG